MLTQILRDSLDDDTETLVFAPRRGTVRVHGAGIPSLLIRCGVEQLDLHSPRTLLDGTHPVPARPP